MPVPLEELYFKIDARLDEFEKKLGLASGKAKTAGQKAGQAFASSFGVAVNGAANAAFYGLTLPIAGVAKATFDATIKFERMKAGLTALMGSSQKAATEIEKLRRVAQLPGLSFDQAVQASQAFQAVGASADQARRMIAALAKANARSAGDPANFGEAVRQFQQMIALGRVTMEDLRPLMTRIPEFGTIMQKKFNAGSPEQIQKMFQSGKLTMGAFVEGMVEGMEAGKAVPDNLANDFDNLKDSIDQTLQAIGQDLMPTFRDLLKEVNNATKWWKDLNKEQREFYEKALLVVALVGPAGKLIVGITNTTKAVWGLASAWGAVKLAAGEAATAEGVAAGSSGAAGGPSWLKGAATALGLPLLGWMAADATVGKGPNPYAEIIPDSQRGLTKGQLADLIRKDVAKWTLPDSGVSKASLTGLGNTSGTGKEADPALLTAAMVREMAKGIRTPKGQASCAFFASELLQQYAEGIKKEGGARALVKQLLDSGASPHGIDKAQVGDLGFVRGPGYGAIKDKNGIGYHDFISLGDGRVIQSSNGVVSIKKAPEGAQFLTPNLKKQFSGGAVNSLEYVDQFQDLINADKIKRETLAMKELQGVTSEVVKLQVRYKYGIEESAGPLERQAALAKAAAEDQLAAYDEMVRKARGNGAPSFLFGDLSKETVERIKAAALQVSELKKELDEYKVSQLSAKGASSAEITALRRSLGLDVPLSDQAKGMRDQIDAMKDVDAAYAAMVAKARGNGKPEFLGRLFNRQALDLMKEIADANRAYLQDMRSLDDRYEIATSKTGLYDVTLRHLNETYRDAQKASEMMRKQLEVERVEAFRAEIQRLQQTMEDWVSQTIEGTLKNGFDGLFDGITRGFQNMLAEMAREWIMFQLKTLYQNQLNSLFGGIFGGVSGAVSSGVVPSSFGVTGGYIPGLATGGPALAGRAYVVGEKGPELFYPASNGRVVDAETTRGMSGGGVVVNITVLATDAGSFVKSKDQIAREAGAAIERATRRTA